MVHGKVIKSHSFEHRTLSQSVTRAVHRPIESWKIEFKTFMLLFPIMPWLLSSVRLGHVLTDGHHAASSMAGHTLNITKINRVHMGAYQCLADNGIPPPANQTFNIEVQCMYLELSCEQEFHHFICNTLRPVSLLSRQNTLPSNIRCTTISICNGLTGTLQRNNVGNYFDPRVPFSSVLFYCIAGKVRILEIGFRKIKFLNCSRLPQQSEQSIYVMCLKHFRPYMEK